MYRGMIEGAEWAKEGTYLRQKIKQYQLDKVTDHGRIWRLTYDGIARDRTRAADARRKRPAQLVAHLSHPNGWWRDTAQQLLVLKQDRSVVPALQVLVRTSKNLLARFHALWTLEGLGALDAALTREAAAAIPSPRMRIQALRASETLYKAGDHHSTPTTDARRRTPDIDVVIQAMLTMNVSESPRSGRRGQSGGRQNTARGVQFVGEQDLNRRAPVRRAADGHPQPRSSRTAWIEAARSTPRSAFSCHGDDGRGTPTPGGCRGVDIGAVVCRFARVNGHRDYVIKAVCMGWPVRSRAAAIRR